MNMARASHTLTGSGMACGGHGGRTSCEVLKDGDWQLLDSKLSKVREVTGRVDHSGWLERSTNTTFLLGGGPYWVERVSSSDSMDWDWRVNWKLAFDVR